MPADIFIILLAEARRMTQADADSPLRICALPEAPRRQELPWQFLAYLMMRRAIRFGCV